MSDISTSNTQTTPTQDTPKNLIPLGVTIGLTIFALLLTLMGYGFRLLVGDSMAEVARHAVVVLSFFLIVFPALITAGSKLMNKFWNRINSLFHIHLTVKTYHLKLNLMRK